MSCLIDSRLIGEGRRKRKGKKRKTKRRSRRETLLCFVKEEICRWKEEEDRKETREDRASDRIKQYSRGQDGGRSSCYTVTVLKSVTDGGTKADGEEELLKT